MEPCAVAPGPGDSMGDATPGDAVFCGRMLYDMHPSAKNSGLPEPQNNVIFNELAPNPESTTLWALGISRYNGLTTPVLPTI